ncbi:hypothetical protein BDA99DRAFT_543533 [Phascolomyces articulosus]|uniref:Uncharacterized protein n=1 Tax=Phascolomyces articulosus TaxID=60185 RepID=A0AAD5P9A8_9FUNG|nr:hypothetical protein BDA99DRAFT_543533 [Phascolomyces articulosus]
MKANLPAAEALIFPACIQMVMCTTETLPNGHNQLFTFALMHLVLFLEHRWCVWCHWYFLHPRMIRKMLFPKIVTSNGLIYYRSPHLFILDSRIGLVVRVHAFIVPRRVVLAVCPTSHAPNPQIWGGPVNFGLGASVVSIGLAVGCIIASAIGMFDSSGIDAAPAGTLPFLFTQLDMIIETLGDLPAASDVSGLPTEVNNLKSVVKNNGNMVVTWCASHMAASTMKQINDDDFNSLDFLCVFGNSLSSNIGGMTVFLFASVATSDALVPDWFTYDLPRADDNNPGLQGLYDIINAIVSTSYILAGLMSVILPYEEDEESLTTIMMSGEKQTSLPVASTTMIEKIIKYIYTPIFFMS